MKAILVVLLIIGVESAVPLKLPTNDIQNSDTRSQQTQENQEYYQSLIATFPAQYQLAAQWLVSQGFALPQFYEIQNVLGYFDLGSFKFLQSLNLDEILDIFNIKQFFSRDMFLKFVYHYVASIEEAEVAGFEDTEVAIIPAYFAMQFLEDFPHLTQLAAHVLFGVTLNVEEYLTQEVFVAIFLWAVKYPLWFEYMLNLYIDFLPAELVISFLYNTVNYVVSNLVNSNLELLENINYQQFFQDTLQNLVSDIEQLITPETVNEISDFLANSEIAEIPISLLTSLGIESSQLLGQLNDGSFNLLQYFTQETAVAALEWIYVTNPNNEFNSVVEIFNEYFPIDQIMSLIVNTVNTLVSNFANRYVELLDTFNYQQLFQDIFENSYIPELLNQDSVYQILMFCITNLDDATIPIDFLTSLGINYFYVFGQIFSGTFNPQQYFTPDIIFKSFQWATANPNKVEHLLDFFNDYLPINQIISSFVDAVSILDLESNPIPNIIFKLYPKFLPNILQNLSQSLLQKYLPQFIQTLGNNSK